MTLYTFKLEPTTKDYSPTSYILQIYNNIHYFSLFWTLHYYCHTFTFTFVINPTINWYYISLKSVDLVIWLQNFKIKTFIIIIITILTSALRCAVTHFQLVSLSCWKDVFDISWSHWWWIILAFVCLKAIWGAPGWLS